MKSSLKRGPPKRRKLLALPLALDVVAAEANGCTALEQSVTVEIIMVARRSYCKLTALKKIITMVQPFREQLQASHHAIKTTTYNHRTAEQEAFEIQAATCHPITTSMKKDGGCQELPSRSEEIASTHRAVAL
jgi:hypothetical protein